MDSPCGGTSRIDSAWAGGCSWPISTNDSFTRIAHYVSGSRVADVQGLLLHYRFDASFRELCIRHVREKSHFNRSAEYRCYLAALDAKPDLSLRDAWSVRYHSARQMLEAGSISVSGRFVDFATGPSLGPRTGAD